MPEIRLKKVVFPAPFGPMIETICPGSAVRETLSTAVTPPNAIEMSFAMRIGLIERDA
jgi:hypothetical protein